MRILHPSPFDPGRLSAEEKDALIVDPVNRGLKWQEVEARLGSGISGGESTIRRVRQRAGLDSRGYPIHSSHHLAEPLDPLPEPSNLVDRVMRENPKQSTAGPRRDVPRRPKLGRSRQWPEGECVYFIQAGDGEGPIKIGCTRDLDRRYADLTVANAVPLTVIGLIRGYRPTEQHLHRLFAKDRLQGEWFRPTERIVALAKGRLFLGSNGRLRERT